MNLGDNIKSRRRELKLSQEYIAEQLGVSRQAISKWETGQTEPSTSNLIELAKVLNTTVLDLFGEKQEKSKKEIFIQNWEICAVGFYTGAVIMTGVRTNDEMFYVFANIMVLITAILMGINILRLPQEVMLKVALKELAYCVVLYGIMAFLSPVIGNILASVIVCVCCVFYVKKIRFKHYFIKGKDL